MCFVMTKASLCLSQWISGTTKLLLWQTWQKWYLWQLPPMTHIQCTAQIIDFVRNGSALLSLERQQSTATQNKGTTFSFTFTLHPSNVHHTPSKSNPQMRCFWLPKHNLKSFCQCSFSFITLPVWNLLPASLRHLPTLSKLKNTGQDFLFQTGLSTNLGRSFLPAVIVMCVIVVYSCLWVYMYVSGVC